MVVHGIRIAETGVRFSLGPHEYYFGKLAPADAKALAGRQLQPEADPPLAEVRAKGICSIFIF